MNRKLSFLSKDSDKLQRTEAVTSRQLVTEKR